MQAVAIASVNGFDVLIAGGGLYDRSLHFFDLRGIERGEVLKVKEVTAHAKSITKILSSTCEKNIVITCSSDGTLKIWKINAGVRVKEGAKVQEGIAEDDLESDEGELTIE